MSRYIDLDDVKIQKAINGCSSTELDSLMKNLLVVLVKSTSSAVKAGVRKTLHAIDRELSMRATMLNA